MGARKTKNQAWFQILRGRKRKKQSKLKLEVHSKLTAYPDSIVLCLGQSIENGSINNTRLG